jgi:PAS domain S-box-containing protein
MFRPSIPRIAPHFLHFESRTSEADLILGVLSPDYPNSQIENVRTPEDFAAALERAEPDLILCGLSSPTSGGPGVLELARQRRPEAPFIIISNRAMEDSAIKALDQGAIDYLVNDCLGRLPKAVRRALDEKNDKRQLLQDRDEIRLINERLQFYELSVKDLIWDWNLVSGERSQCDGMVESLGYAPNEINAKFDDWIRFVHPDDVARVRKSILAAPGGTQDHWTEEFSFLHKHGHHVSLRAEGFVVRDSAGQAVRMIGSLSDITGADQSGARLLRQPAKLGWGAEAISLRNLDDGILCWSKGAERVYGWAQSEAVGRRSTELIEKGLAEYEDAKKALLAKGRWIGRLPKAARNGRRLKIESRWILLRDEQGRAKSILAIDSDVSETEKIEVQSLRNQRMESLGTLASGIAHDLNNVLAPICMAIALLKLKIPADKDTTRVLDMLEANTRRGARLIKQVLTFGRGIEGDRIMVDLAYIVREIEEMAQDTFPKAIQFSVNLPSDLWTVAGDPTQLHQVLLNLSVNARDAMPEGGKLTIGLQNLSLDATYAAMNPEAKPGPYVVVTVTDTGNGIPAEIQDKIFDPFFSTKGAGKGTGLGLATSLAIVKGHGGFITVQSEVHKGASFNIHLPAISTHLVTDNVEESQASISHGSDELVLVVDDEEPIRIVIEETLKKFGYRVILASNGAEAVSRYAMHHDDIAVVITDVVMPVMDGVATAVALKTINPRVRIIGSSGMGSDPVGNRSKLLNVGVKHFISKPFAAETLLRLLSKVIHRGSRPPR